MKTETIIALACLVSILSWTAGYEYARRKIISLLPGRPQPWRYFGKQFIHPKWGRVMAIAPHPHDGAAWVIQRMETTDPDDDDHVFDCCERSDLVLAEEQDQWPYLGFTKASVP